jgi:hypothetical protein
MGARHATDTVTVWAPALDALEAWIRRTAEGVAAGEPPTAPPALPGPTVPASLALRARTLVAAMHDLEVEVLRKRELLARQRRYGAA